MRELYKKIGLSQEEAHTCAETLHEITTKAKSYSDIFNRIELKRAFNFKERMYMAFLFGLSIK